MFNDDASLLQRSRINNFRTQVSSVSPAEPPDLHNDQSESESIWSAINQNVPKPAECQSQPLPECIKVIRRNEEEDACVNNDYEECTTQQRHDECECDNDEIAKIIWKGLTISTEDADSFFRLQNEKIIKVSKVCGSTWEDLSLTCTVLKVENFFTQPMETQLVDVHAWKANAWYPLDVTGVKVEDIKHKYCAVPTDLTNRKFLLTPFGDDY
jgi:hypothetical protein